MKIITSRTKSLTCLSAALLVSCNSVFAANNTWNANDGDWASSSWSLGTPPTSADQAIFALSTSSSNTAISVSVDGNVAASHISVGRGKTVTLNLAENASLNASGGTWQIGSGVGTGATNAAGHLKIHGPETGSANVVVGAGGINIGASAAQIGNSLELAGNIHFQAAGGVVVGRYGNDNLLTIKDGTEFTASSIWVSATQNITNGIGDNNGAVISGTGTLVTLAPTTNLALVVAARPTTNLSTQQTGNYVRIEEGAIVRIDGANSSTTADLKLGDTSYRVGNYVTVTGTGSLLEMKNGTKISIGTNINSAYNNYLSVSDGGVIKNDGTTSIMNTRTSGGKNRLVIGNGTFLAGGEIKASGGLVQLAEGGVLRGETVAGALTPVDLVIEGLGTAIGRFEVAGSGLASNVNTTIKSGGAMAVGLASATKGSTFTLNSVLDLQSAAVLEIGIFGDGSIDSIHLGATGSFNIASDAVFTMTLNGYDAQMGDAWSIFTGEIGNIIGEFDMSLASLPVLGGGLSWDYSNFNQAGNWQVAVIPEPSSVFLLLSAGAVAFGALRRVRRSSDTN